MEDNKTKEEILREAADNYVSNHADGEVRRMYGHHLRSFKDGWNAHESYSQQSTKQLQDRVKELEKVLGEAYSSLRSSRIEVVECKCRDHWEKEPAIYLIDIAQQEIESALNTKS